MTGFITDPLRVSASVLSQPPLLSFPVLTSLPLLYIKQPVRIFECAGCYCTSFCLKTKRETLPKNRQGHFGMPMVGQRCRRKQLILISNVQSEEEDCFGPSSERHPPTQTPERKIYRERERVSSHVLSICFTQ